MNKILPVVAFIFCLVALGGVGFLGWRQIQFENEVKLLLEQQSKQVPAPAALETESTTATTFECSEICEQEISDAVAEAVSGIEIPTSETQTIVQQTVAADSQTKTSYIPLDSSYNSPSQTWVDVPTSGVYIDLANDFSEDAYVTWEASLKVEHGNGTAYARLYDVTHSIAVDGSEISTSNTSDYVSVKSGSLPLWRGNNLYRVQIRSLNGYDAYYTGGRIKITYK